MRAAPRGAEPRAGNRIPPFIHTTLIGAERRAGNRIPPPFPPVGPWEIRPRRDCEVSAIAVYFDVSFPGSSGRVIPLQLSTSPAGPLTHWQQTVLYLKVRQAYLKEAKKTKNTKIIYTDGKTENVLFDETMDYLQGKNIYK